MQTPASRSYARVVAYFETDVNCWKKLGGDEPPFVCEEYRYEDQITIQQSSRETSSERLSRFPVATVAFYGPDDQSASKLVIGIITHDGAEPKLRRWYSDDSDLRSVPQIEFEIQAFIKETNHSDSVARFIQSRSASL